MAKETTTPQGTEKKQYAPSDAFCKLEKTTTKNGKTIWKGIFYLNGIQYEAIGFPKVDDKGNATHFNISINVAGKPRQ